MRRAEAVGELRRFARISPGELVAGNPGPPAYDKIRNPCRRAMAQPRSDTESIRSAVAYVQSTLDAHSRKMQPAGIDLEIRSLDWGTFFEHVKQGNFQLFGLTWVGIKTPDIYAKALGSQNFPPNGFNRGRYTDKTLDELLAKEDWQSATARIHNQLPYIPLWYEGQFVAMRKEIQNYLPKPDGNWDDLATITK